MLRNLRVSPEIELVLRPVPGENGNFLPLNETPYANRQMTFNLGYSWPSCTEERSHNPFRDSLVIARERKVMDGQTDTGTSTWMDRQERTIYASLGGGIIKYC